MLVKELSDKAMEVMKSMDYQPCTITSIYSSSIRPILDYYLAEGIEEYDPNLRSQIETMYLEQYREGTISRSTYYKRLRGTDIFDAVHETGAYEWRKHASDVIAPVQSYSGTISEHLSTRKLNPKSLRAERMYLGEFSIFCAESGLSNPCDINGETVLRFIKCKGLKMTVGLEKVATAISKYLAYLFEAGIIDSDLHSVVKVKGNRDRKVKMPFDIDVLNRLLESIDTDTGIGKRDYAILLLVAYTGMRSCDVLNLRLNDIDWKEMTIGFVQTKTGVAQCLPLNKEVCDALADYILNGRPKCRHQFVFARELSPFGKLHDSCALNSMLRRRLSLIGVDRRQGDGLTVHGIRRALGTQMVKSSAPVDTVAQVLGHQSTRATRQYIAIDIEGLKMCALSFDVIGYGGSL